MPLLVLVIGLSIALPAHADVTWQKTGGLEGGFVYALAIDPGNSRTIYAGTAGGVYKAMNGGATWRAVNTGLTDLQVNTLAIDPVNSQTIYAGTEAGGVFKTTNGGDSWSAANTGLTYTDVTSLAIDPN